MPRINNFIFQSSDMSKDQANKVWSTLKKGITEIQNGNACQLRFEELYRNAYTLVLHKHGDLLYGGVEDTIHRKLSSSIEELAPVANNLLISQIVDKWEGHKLVMTMIRDILMYMDKTHCEQKKKTQVYDLGMFRWRDIILRNARMKEMLRVELLANITSERCGELIDRTLMRKALNMLVDVNVNSTEVYVTDFEDAFLEETRSFYEIEAQKFMAENTVQDYLRKAEARLNEEEKRADEYLDLRTRAKLLKACEKQLIEKFAKTLVDNMRSGCVPMLQQDLVDDLGRMYKLFKRVDGSPDIIRRSMFDLVKATGMKIVSDPENKKSPHQFIDKMLLLKQKYDTILKHAFQSDKDFQRSITEAFEDFVNGDCRTAQFLSLFVDGLMKNDKGISDSEMDLKMENCITLFKFIHDKDVFEEFYKQHLALRLLMSRKGNDDLEKKMIGLLKKECGHQFTSKLEGMFNDMKASQDIVVDYKRWNQERNQPHNDSVPELACQVLTQGFWPSTDSSPEINLPVPAQAAADRFKQYYTAKHQQARRLAWRFDKGDAELSVRFDGGDKNLIVTVYQMCVLMLFNDHDIITFEKIQSMTNIPQQELQRHILSLAHPKIKVLDKNPNSRKVSLSDKFRLNRKYKNKLFRVKIPLLQDDRKEQETNANEVPPEVEEARKNRVDAAVVRIMKSRKTLDHNALITEVCKQLSSRFQVPPPFIKKRIEGLIEREFLERDPNNRKRYSYLA